MDSPIDGLLSRDTGRATGSGLIGDEDTSGTDLGGPTNVLWVETGTKGLSGIVLGVPGIDPANVKGTSKLDVSAELDLACSTTLNPDFSTSAGEGNPESDSN